MICSVFSLDSNDCSHNANEKEAGEVLVTFLPPPRR